MRRTQHLMISFLAALLMLGLVWGCSDDDDNGPTTPPPPGTEDAGTISGIVRTVGGFPLGGATVAAGSTTTTTNQDGYFVLAAVPVGPTVVTISFAEYMPTFRALNVIEGGATHYGDITLLDAETATIDGAAGGQAATTNGVGEVDFAANSFVNGAGQPHTGDVIVELSAMVPSDETYYGAFPGEFAGIREDGGAEVPFISYGFMTVNLYDVNKSPLRLADGITAALSLTIDPGKAATAPPTIPMWWFNEDDGRWYEEGEATLAGNVYTADVAHFTTWNWDLPVEDICSITGTVVDDNGLPVAGARVISRGVEDAIMDEAFTNSSGVYNVRALRNALTDVWAMAGSRASEPLRVAVGGVCPHVLSGEQALVLVVPAYSISLTWGASPSDLDSHLLVPMTWDAEYDYYHIYYSNMGNYSDNPYAALDTDDTNSFGPEIITGTRLYNGRFQYWVHNFGGNTNGFQSSDAVIQLNLGGALWIYEVADVPLQGADATGWWHVFDIVVTGGVPTVQRVMQFQPRFSNEGVYDEDKNAGSMPTKQR